MNRYRTLHAFRHGPRMRSILACAACSIGCPAPSTAAQKSARMTSLDSTLHGGVPVGALRRMTEHEKSSETAHERTTSQQRCVRRARAEPPATDGQRQRDEVVRPLEL